MEAAADLLRLRWDVLNASVRESVRLAWWTRILKAHAEPHRHYHNLTTMQRTFQLYDMCSAKLKNRSAVALAIFFQHLCFNSESSSEDADTAKLLREFGKEASVEQTAEYAADLVERSRVGNKHDVETSNDYDDVDYYLDFQLAPIGYDANDYENYKRQTRMDYPNMNEKTYEAKRLKVLRALLTVPRIFRTTLFHDLFEKQARENIAREIEQLSGAA